MTLACIFNHRHDANFEYLERIYAEKFEHLIHIVPFYDGDKSNVIRVFENSHRFQGYVAQAAARLLETGSDYYIFAADDLMLSPVLSSATVLDLLGIPQGYSYIPLRRFLENMDYWVHTQSAVFMGRNARGAEAWSYLPSPEEAETLLARHGVKCAPAISSRAVYRKPSLRSVYRKPRLTNVAAQTALLCRRLLNRKIPLAYPLVCGYSDFFVVSRQTLPQFAYYCGIFAAMNLFVEIAIPTALVFSTDKLIHSLPQALSGMELWQKKDITAFKQRYAHSLAKLLLNFPQGAAYVHPVKLSQWTEE